MRKEQRCFPFSCIVNSTLKNTLQETLCLEIKFIISILLTVAAAKNLQPFAGGFPFSYKLQKSERHNSCWLLSGIGSFLEIKLIERRQNQLSAKKKGFVRKSSILLVLIRNTKLYKA